MTEQFTTLDGTEDRRCAAAREALVTGALQGLPAAGPVERHMAECPACRAQVAGLARAIVSASADEIPCAECLVWLDRYLGAETAGAPIGQGFRLVAAHLALCPSCAGAAATWRSVAAGLGSIDLSESPDVPRFDLSFLSGDVTAGPAPFWRRWADRCRDVPGRIGVALRARRSGSEGDRGPRDGLAPLASVGALVPVLALLIVALALAWTALRTVPAPPAPVSARRTTEARLAAARTATARAAGAERTRRASPGDDEGPPRPDGSGARTVPVGTHVPAWPSATWSPTPSASPRPSGANQRDDRDGGRGDTERPNSPQPTQDAPVTVTSLPIETAYPRPQPGPPATGYPKPATRLPAHEATATRHAPRTPTADN